MKRQKTLIIAGLCVLAAAAAWAAFFRSPGDGEMELTRDERRIQREIDRANRCATASDCAQAAAAICPFGCYVHVHKDEVERISSMLVEYQKTGASTCMYSCIEYPGVDCVSGRCELKQ